MNDDHAGQGGSYLLDPATGARTLIARTQPPASAEAKTDKPADAGFISPVNPAEPTTTKE